MSKLTLFLLFLHLAAVFSAAGVKKEWAKTVDTSKGYKTTLDFYFHDIQTGKTPSTVLIAHAEPNSTNSITGFGILVMADDKLTVGADPASKLIGRAQGLYGYASREELALIMAISFVFTEGVYNGSTINIMGWNPATHANRELPVVGGTGVFRMATGYALGHIYFVDFNTKHAIVGYNVTVFH